LLDKAMLEVRRISRNLRPSELDDLGLVPALRSLCAEFGERTGIAVELSCPDQTEKLSAEVELVAYRIAQEALTNVEKHAGAQHVTVELASDNVRLRLRLRDDGCGFDRNAPTPVTSKNGGMGLLDIEERVRLVNGTCTVNSAPAAGTEVAIELPLTARSAATRPMPEPAAPLT